MEENRKTEKSISLHILLKSLCSFIRSKQDSLIQLAEILEKLEIAKKSDKCITFKDISKVYILNCNSSTNKRSNNFIDSIDDMSTNKRTDSDKIREILFTRFIKNNYKCVHELADIFKEKFKMTKGTFEALEEFKKDSFDNEDNKRELVNFFEEKLESDSVRAAWAFVFLCFPKTPSDKNTDFRLMLLKNLLQSGQTKNDFQPLDITGNDKQIEKVNNGNIGRSKEIEEIKREMLSNNSVLVYGIGGIGKSYICRKLFWTYYDSFSDGIEYLAWIQYNGNLTQSISSSFYEAEANLDNIRKKYDNHPVIGDMFVKLALTEKPEDKVQVIKEHFNKLGNRLLVFIDNADTMTKDEKKWLNACKCRMIITSRQKIDGFHNVNIDSPSPEYCKEMYVREIWENSKETYSLDDEKYIKKITELANYHTQTVMLIAKAQICLGLSSEEMLDELNKTGFVLKGNDEIIDTEEYDLTMAEHLTKIFNLLNVSDETQLRTIRLFSLLASNTPIKKRDIKKWFELSNLSSINELVKYGWLNGSGSEYVSIHPVIADVVMYNYKPDFEFALPLINALQEEMKTADDYIKKNAVIVHCVAVASILESIKEKRYVKFLNGIASIFHDNAAYADALKYYQISLEIQKIVFGNEHPDTATIYDNMAVLFDDQGDYIQALAFFNKALTIRKLTLGSNHSATATTYNNMAVTFSEQGEHIKALKYS